MSSASPIGPGPVPPAGTSALLRATWASLAPVVRACLDPSPRAAARVSATPIGALHSALYRVCASPPSAASPPQPHYIYALLRAQIVIHARAVAKLLAASDQNDGESSPSEMRRAYPPPVHLVDEQAVDICAAALEGSLRDEEPEFVDASCLSPSWRVLSAEVDSQNNSRYRPAILVRYARLWSAYAKGLSDVAALFSYIDRVWVQARGDLGISSLGDDEKQALGMNLAVYDVRTTGLLAWLCEIINPLGSRVARAALDTIAADRSSRRLDVALLNARTDHCASVDSKAFSGLCVEVLKPVLESFCIIGHTQATVEGLTSQAPLLSFPTGIPSTSVSGLSQASLHPDPLRVPSPEREASRYALYRTLFETPFVSNAYRFYAEESSALFSRSSFCVRDYVQSVESLLTRDLVLVGMYADRTTVDAVRSVLEKALVGDHSAALNTEADAMFKDRAVKDLQKLYALLQRTPNSLHALHVLLRSHVEAEGLAALRPWTSYDSSFSVQDQLDASWLPVFPKHQGSDARSSLLAECGEAESLYRILPQTPAGGFVQAAWGVYALYAALAEEAFGSDRDFANALERGCERFVNSVRAAPELLAQFCHDLLEESIPCRGAHADLARPLSSSGKAPACAAVEEDGGSGRESGRDWTCSRDLSWDPAVATEDAKTWIVRATRLFRFLTDKDVFQRIYAVKLTRRLVYRTSLSQQVEEFMLDLLRETCGRDYTSRLQRMFSDIVSSAEESSGFARARLEGKIPNLGTVDVGIKVDAMVLSSAAWPVFSRAGGQSGQNIGDSSEAGPRGAHLLPSSPNPASPGDSISRGLSLFRTEERRSLQSLGDTPPLAQRVVDSGSGAFTPVSLGIGRDSEGSREELRSYHDSAASLALTSLASLPTRVARLSASFVEYYNSSHPRHEGRKLQWMYNLCRVEIEAYLGSHRSKPLMIEASLPQAAVLLQFNDQDFLSVESLSRVLGISVSDLGPVIEVLLQADILVCHDGGKFDNTSLISGSTVLHVNDSGVSFPLNTKSCVPLALMSYHGEEKARVRRTRLGINTDRRQQVKASIVRIMKQRSTLTEVELVRLVQEKLSRWFFPREGDVIAGIATLVENEYMEPVEGGAYVYLP